MARNDEIKARIERIESILPKVAAIADKGPVEIIQDDIFFACPNGRLKLRVVSPGEGELIFYRRSDQTGPKESFYLVYPTTAPDVLRESLSLAYGEVGRVRKKRTIFHMGRTRIHLDRVENLGTFLELEVVLTEEEEVQIGAAIAQDFIAKLGILPDQLIDGAYVDLISQEMSIEALQQISETMTPDELSDRPS